VELVNAWDWARMLILGAALGAAGEALAGALAALVIGSDPTAE
jgi:hypothetical protein